MNRCLVLLCLAAAACPAPAVPHDESAHADQTAHWTCPMHPSVKSATPASCPICGMDLTPVTADALASGDVTVDVQRQQTWGIRTVVAERRALTREIRLAGPVAWSTQGQRDVTVRAAGVVTGLAVAVGSPVRAGAVLFRLRSPELSAAQGEYLALDAANRGPAADRLRALGLSAAQVDRLTSTGRVEDTLAVTAPISGTISDLDVVEGSPVGPWTAPARVAAVGRVWLDAIGAEADASWLRPQTAVHVTAAAHPGHSFTGQVSAAPGDGSVLQRFRVEIDDPHGRLQPGQVAVATATVTLEEGVVVPADAVIFAGARQVAFVDVGDGRLERREVVVGARADGALSLRSGVSEGEKVVRDGNFLVAADSRLQAPDRWSAP